MDESSHDLDFHTAMKQAYAAQHPRHHPSFIEVDSSDYALFDKYCQRLNLTSIQAFHTLIRNNV